MAFNLDIERIEWVAKGITFLQHDIMLFLGEKQVLTVFGNGSNKNKLIGRFLGKSIVKINFREA